MAETYTIDAWGNLQQNGNYNFNQPFSANNQIYASGYSYDAAGNLTGDGIGNTYTYDANGMLTASSGSQYVYDAIGQRVEKISGGTSMETIYFNGQALARHNASTGAYTDLVWANGVHRRPTTGCPIGKSLDRASTTAGWLSFGAGLGAIASGAGEEVTLGADTPITITFTSVAGFFGTARTLASGGAAALNTFAAGGNPTAIQNFAWGQLANVAFKERARFLDLTHGPTLLEIWLNKVRNG